jgi:hypothetical protein
VAERVQVRPISNDDGNRLLRILRRGTGSVVTWRGAQMVLLSAQAMDVPQIARVTFTSEDRVRDVITTSTPMDSSRCTRAIRAVGRRSSPRSSGIKRIALSRPEDHDLPFSTWSLAKLAD